jgi:hypothetical protein
MGPLVANPAHASPKTGEKEMRPREGFSHPGVSADEKLLE